VFIRTDWDDLPARKRPELLRPLTTHHIARRFRAEQAQMRWQILYPHESVQGERRAAALEHYPRSGAYLEQHRSTLASREYVLEAGRKWYEIWVPQDPAAWDKPKLVFRDIAEEPTFWIDTEGTIVNGDCYWLICDDPAQTDLLWLAVAVANSTFITTFYDCQFNNKLYAGRRRFITQYVEKFPLPDPLGELGKAIIHFAKKIYEHTPSAQADAMQKELDAMVWMALCGAHPS
jgi:hypothetical protein